MVCMACRTASKDDLIVVRKYQEEKNSSQLHLLRISVSMATASDNTCKDKKI